jgi:hypothetical protein
VIDRERLRAPPDDGGILLEPPLTQAAQLLAGNRRQFSAISLSILGRPLQDLRDQARHEILEAAAAYLQAAGEEAPSQSANQRRGLPPPGLILAGHQPELCHPGVWVKNFALWALARTHGLLPVNLIVDIDTVKSLALTLPGPLTTHHSPLTTDHSPLTTDHRPLPTPHSPLPTPHSPLPTPHSPLPTHCSSHCFRHGSGRGDLRRTAGPGRFPLFRTCRACRQRGG